MQYDFTTLVDRRDTGSLKWEKYRARDVLPFWVADMDFRAPPCIVDAVAQRAAHGVYGYTIPSPSVEEAVIDYMQRAHNIAVKKEWIIWMPGLVPALNTAARALENHGDSVITCTPVYPPFLSAPQWQKKELTAVPLIEENGRYTFDRAAIESKINERTQMFILCNPHNPGGRVFDREELSWLLNLCAQHNILLVSDEIHCDLVIEPGVRHNTILSLGEAAYEHTITMMAPSKTYNVPGLACSFIIIPNDDIRRRFQHASRGMITEINAFGYVGCEAAYRHGEAWRLELIQVLRANRDRLYSFVRENMPRIRMLPMQATYLAWMDVRDLGLDNPPAHFEAHGIGLSDGRLFYGEGHLRFNFGCPAEHMEHGLQRMLKAYKAL